MAIKENKTKWINIAVTTSVEPSEALLARAGEISVDLQCPLLDRDRRGLKQLMERHHLDRVFVLTKEQLVLHGREGSLFWHPGTSVLKLWAYAPSNNKHKQLEKTLDIIRATGIQPGDQILDCTLGYGSDAIVLSWACGPTGRVVGLEADLCLAYLTGDGLRTYKNVAPQVREAMGRIEVVQSMNLAYLRQLPANSFDVVYFDPMFQEGLSASKPLQALRAFACTAILDIETLHEAKRVARRRVVVKERIGSGVFEALGIEKTLGGWRTGAVAYGLVDLI